MHIQIKLKFTNTILFEGKYNSLKDAVVNAVAKKINLIDACLRGAYLRGAYLRGADLRGASLESEILKIAPLQMQLLLWDILITPQYLKIGCERHTHEEWAAFTDAEISRMHDKALEWWKDHKELLMMACELHKKQSEKE